MNLDELEQLVALLQNSNVRELTLKQGDKRLTLRRETSRNDLQTEEPEMLHPVELNGFQVDFADEQAEAQAVVSAPYVGVFHHIRPMTGMGASVAAGQIMCAIQSMDILNEVAAPAAGTVVDIHVQDNQPVEYGQLLYTIQTKED